MDYKQIIKDYMKQNRVTYQDLALQLGTSRQNVWSALNGKKNNNKDEAAGSRSVNQDLLNRMMDALGLEVRIGIKR